MKIAKTINKVESKIQREFVQLPIVSHLLKKSYQQKTVAHNQNLPTLDPQDREIVNHLSNQGLLKTDLDWLSISGTQRLIELGNKLLSTSPKLIRDTTSMRLPGIHLKYYPELLRWGLDERLLDIAETYIGLPIFYLGAELRKEVNNGESVGVRKWHLDTEDYRMMKIIIYLTDVDESCAPFQCLAKPTSDIAVKNLRYKSGLISDKKMKKYVPEREWVSCIGKKHTAVIVDTASVLHRVKPAVSKERRSITFHYISQSPIHLRLRSQNLSISRSVKHLYPDATQRQLGCLFGT